MNRNVGEKYKLHLDEYMNFVTSNKRFPDLNDEFSTGTKMYSWRRYARNIIKDKNVLDFDEGIEKEIKNNQSFYKVRLKNQRIYNEITKHKRTKNDPQTYEEYMKGNNRFHYFDLSTYEEIIRIIGNVPKEEVIFACNIRLLQSIYSSNMSWAEFHKDYDMTNFVSHMMKTVHSLSDRESMIISMKYGLENGHRITVKELSKIFNVSGSRIGSIEVKALRKLRHPKVLMNIKSKHEIHGAVKDHWFIIDIQRPNTTAHEYLGMHRNAHEVDELFAALSEDYDIDIVDPKSEYKLRSIETRNTYAYEIDDEIAQSIGIPKEDISGNVVYSYTMISIDEVPSMTTEEYVEQQLEEQEIEAGKESLITNSLKNHKEETENMMFIVNDFSTLFQTACQRTCRSINFDGGGKWIDEFNERMRHYAIPLSCIAESAGILRVTLLNYLYDFSCTCRYIQSDDMYYYYIHLECEE